MLRQLAAEVRVMLRVQRVDLVVRRSLLVYCSLRRGVSPALGTGHMPISRYTFMKRCARVASGGCE